MPDMRKFATAVMRTAVGALNMIMPKRQKCVLSGFPDTEDSIVELARNLSARGDIETIVLAEDVAASAARFPGISWCRKRSLRGFLHYLTARFVFFTHGVYLSPKPPQSQVCVNIWHGMPIKRVGYMAGRVPPRSTVVIATSPLFSELVGQCFGKPRKEVLVTGLPRNDVLVRSARRACEIKEALGLAGSPVQSRLLVWLPTFRRAVRGIVCTDGKPHESIFGLDDMDIGAFETFLRSNNCVCIIKSHPMADEYADHVVSNWIRIWRDGDLADHGVSLYEMVGASDLLITDASSVYVDYMILNKPVVMAFPDIEAYRESRGFALEPVEDYFAGPLATSFAELIAGLSESLNNDRYANCREQVAARFHAVRDDGATRRLIVAVMPSAKKRSVASINGLPHAPRRNV